MRRPALLTVFLLLGIPAAAQTASFQGLGDLYGLGSTALGASADGTVVVGMSDSAKGREAFRWTTTGGMASLGHLPGGGFYSFAQAASADGTVVVGGSDSANGQEAFRWTAASGMVGLGDFPGGEFGSTAYGVSADGSTMVGYGTSADGQEAALWSVGGGLVSLGVLPGGSFSYSRAYAVSADGTVVVGASSSQSGQDAFRWTAAGGMVGLNALPGGAARAVSADGSAVAGLRSRFNSTQAFRWTSAGGVVGLEAVPGATVASLASGLSADGTVVVGWGGNTMNSTAEATLWTAESGMQTLSSLLTSAGVDLTGWTLHVAVDISADGTVIVGSGTNPHGNPEAWRAVLPRPSVGSNAPPGPASNLTLVAAPNPLRDRATLRFTTPVAGPVRLSLRDVLGREVAVVADGWRIAGPHEATLDGSALPAGVYVVRLAAGPEATTRRITVAR